jgi:ERCC4-related helicase
MKKIPHFGTTLNRDQMPSFVLKHVSEIDVSTVFIPYKEVSYFQIEQFSYPSMQHCRAIRTLLNYLEEIYSKKIIVKREERDFLDEILYYYLEGNKGKKFTVQAIFNRKNELGLNKQLQSEITLNMINEFLEALEKKNKILSEQKGSEKYYFC